MNVFLGEVDFSRVHFPSKDQDFYFLLQDPRTLELIFKPREAQPTIDFDTFFKGF